MERSYPFFVAVVCGQLLGRKQVLHRTNLSDPSQLHNVLSDGDRAFGRLGPHALEFDVGIWRGRSIYAVRGGCGTGILTRGTTALGL